VGKLRAYGNAIDAQATAAFIRASEDADLSAYEPPAPSLLDLMAAE